MAVGAGLYEDQGRWVNGPAPDVFDAPDQEGRYRVAFTFFADTRVTALDQLTVSLTDAPWELRSIGAPGWLYLDPYSFIMSDNKEEHIVLPDFEVFLAPYLSDVSMRSLGPRRTIGFEDVVRRH